ncbi:MAG: MBL fold metallo-hydrolase [Polyangiaceae bacterium]|nr:MBL fold metallo-hydrolase [Polyangiaceae bacterium]
MSIEVQFWGVRGSIASPGPATAGVGGNTSTVEVRCGDRSLVLDAGTGLRALGDRLMAEGRRDVALLLSHTHWDHIQGLPFFVPLYVPGSRLEIWGPRFGERALADVLARQMESPVFPVRLDETGAGRELHELRGGETFALGDVTVRTAKLHHPGGVLAYRIEHGGRAIVYATDTEHWACLDPSLVALARDADLLVYDAQYTEDEYRGAAGPSRVGWGHSTWEQGVKVADAARVGQLALFHHDPRRDDAAVAELERLAAARRPGTVAAREGMIWRWDALPGAAHAA